MRIRIAGLYALVFAAPAVAQDTTAAPTFAYTQKPKEEAK